MDGTAGSQVRWPEDGLHPAGQVPSDSSDRSHLSEICGGKGDNKCSQGLCSDDSKEDGKEQASSGQLKEHDKTFAKRNSVGVWEECQVSRPFKIHKAVHRARCERDREKYAQHPCFLASSAVQRNKCVKSESIHDSESL